MRSATVALVVALLVVPAGAGIRPAAAQLNAVPLRDLAATHNMLIGSAVSARALAEEPAYASRVATEFSTVTPENELKWQVVEPIRGQLDFSRADQIVDFAQEHGQTVRGHALVWHSELPGWLTGGTFSQAELRDLLKAHIEALMTRYQGRISIWDVVNEPLNEDGTLRNSFWLQNLGPDYILDAFTWARAADPTAKLYLNEYSTEWDGVKARALFDLVRELKAHGVIDGVGFQTHKMNTDRLSALSSTMRRFADLGLEVAITELDVRIHLPADPTELEQQADVYRWATEACLTVGCRSLTVWGFTDAHSWIPNYKPGWGAATLLDESLNSKPAYDQVAATLMTWQPPATGPVGWWRLDDWAGTTAVDFSGHGHSATVTGAALATHERQPGRFAFAGDGSSTGAQTSTSVVDTSRSFTVSAWVSLSTQGHSQVIASQDGTSQSAFVFGYDASVDRWRFTIPSLDGPGATPQTVTSTTAPALGVWTHVTAVWNNGWGRLLLYVNGAWQATTPPSSLPRANSWASQGSFRIGHSMAGDRLAGMISDLRVYDRTLSEQEIAALADPVVGRWTLDGHTGDESWAARDGFPRPEVAHWAPTGSGSLALDLTGAEVIDARGGPGVFTDRSYSVGAWVRLADTSSDHVIASQDGSVRSAFYLQFQASTQKWVFRIPTVDAGYTTWQTVESTAAATTGVWTHVVAVWNNGWGRMQLYVNGVLQATSGPASSWASSPTGQFHIGVSLDGGRFAGEIRDVRLYQKALTAADVQAIMAA